MMILTQVNIFLHAATLVIGDGRQSHIPGSPSLGTSPTYANISILFVIFYVTAALTIYCLLPVLFLMFIWLLGLEYFATHLCRKHYFSPKIGTYHLFPVFPAHMVTVTCPPSMYIYNLQLYFWCWSLNPPTDILLSLKTVRFST